MAGKLYQDKGWLEEQYINQGKSSRVIARDQGVAQPTILYWITKYGLPKHERLITEKFKEYIGKGKPSIVTDALKVTITDLFEDGLGIAEISRYLNISADVISYHIKNQEVRLKESPLKDGWVK